MTDLRTAAQQALEALEGGADSWQLVGPAIDALKEALAEPPVDDPHRDHWVAIAEAAQKIAASKECGLAEAKALCAALDRLSEAALAEPDSDSPERRCGGPGCDGACCQPVQEPVAGRAAFERHAERLGYSVDPDTREGREGGYWSSHTQLMWLTWQAALAETVQEPQGCDHCNHPLYAAIKCRVCGRVTEPTPPQRKPLSGVAIYGLFVRSGLGAYHQKDFVVQTEYDRCIERFARAVERAHGIGGEHEQR